MSAPLFPVFIKLAGRPCLVVGAGEIAEAKIASLLEAGARVTVVSPAAKPEIRQLAEAGQITWEKRKYQPCDLDGAFLAIAATSNTAVNNAVFTEASRLGILCNAVDDPPNCDFYFPAVVRRGDLQIAISTAGESPAFAQKLRQAFEYAFSSNVGDWLAAIGRIRREILADFPASEARKRALHVLANGGACELTNCPGRASGTLAGLNVRKAPMPPPQQPMAGTVRSS
ncbi:MAG TPA: bifunctional precorrin-2 dehydrogenase/sirohydrochlorin ferrochelatase [Candidatus Acidoferrales bacterium]